MVLIEFRPRKGKRAAPDESKGNRILFRLKMVSKMLIIDLYKPECAAQIRFRSGTGSERAGKVSQVS